MLMFECHKCHKCFFVEDAQIENAVDRFCPNCGLRVPYVVMRIAKSIVGISKMPDVDGWDVSHLPDKHFTVKVSVTTAQEPNE